jgi:hypothetical protein
MDRFAGLRVAGHQVASGAGTTVLALGGVRARERPVVRGRFHPDIEGSPSDRLRAYEAGMVSFCDDEEVTGEDRDYRWRTGGTHGGGGGAGGRRARRSLRCHGLGRP